MTPSTIDAAATANPVPTTVTAPAPAVAQPISFHREFLGDLYLFDWKQFVWRIPLMNLLAVAICLGVGIGFGHPGGALIAASGAITVGYGAMQSIEGSRFVPMLGAAIGMAISTLIGMLAGHESYLLLVTCALWGLGYGLLTTRAAGVSWVGQQCVITLVIASAFPFHLHDAAVRASLILAGGLLQILLTSIQLRVVRTLRGDVYALMRHTLAEQAALRANMAAGFRRLLGEDAPPNPVFRFGIRLAIVLALSSEIYRRWKVPSGYWIPMTALLVLKPVFNETVKRALARIGGTLAGAVLTSYLVAHLQPTPVMLAVLVVVFAFCAYSTLNVNYALFTLFLTSYIVFLLSLAKMPGIELAHRRAFATIMGGMLALLVHLDAVRRWRRQTSPHVLAHHDSGS